MSLVSYAQNQEDILLWRALGHIEKGFYIDVGAFYPSADSVSRLFYDKGWRGVSIEPLMEAYTLLVQQRPNDINLRVVAGQDKGESTLYEIPDTGISTTRREIAEYHRLENGYEYAEKIVPCLTLTDIWNNWCPQEVHFLKIDVEGCEADVIEGLDLSTLRPWIIVAEALDPRNLAASYECWEPMLLDAGYHFVYFDGLNRFYVANEHEELDHSFEASPNVFDDFVTADHHNLLANASAQEDRIEQLESESEALRQSSREADRQRLNACNERDRHRLRIEDLGRQIGYIETRLDDEKNRAAQLATENQNLIQEQGSLKQRITWLENEFSIADQHKQQAEHFRNHAEQLRIQLEAVYASRSWRITSPIRVVHNIASHCSSLMIYGIRHPLIAVKDLVRPALLKTMRAVMARPALADGINDTLRRFPRLHGKLKAIACNNGVLTTPVDHYPEQAVAGNPKGDAASSHNDEIVGPMSETTRRVLRELRQARARHNGVQD